MFKYPKAPFIVFTWPFKIDGVLTPGLDSPLMIKKSLFQFTIGAVTTPYGNSDIFNLVFVIVLYTKTSLENPL